jgi:C4-dicarboxylate-specific signal transduction histidine kinase
MILDFSGCDALEVRCQDKDLHYCWLFTAEAGQTGYFRIDADLTVPGVGDQRESLFRDLATGALLADGKILSPRGSLFCADVCAPFSLRDRDGSSREYLLGNPEYRMLLVTPFQIRREDSTYRGLLVLKNRDPLSIPWEDVDLYENLAFAYGVAVSDRRAQSELRERAKEMSTLYEVSRVFNRPEESLASVLSQVVHLIPRGFEGPVRAESRIVLDNEDYQTPGFAGTGSPETADILVDDVVRGTVAVAYPPEHDSRPEGPFGDEGRRFLEVIAREVALMIQARIAQEVKLELMDQLRHADRLATIGELAAGVAHEINEPLSDILGFAQLCLKEDGLSDQAVHDIDRIRSASLHARDVVKKLLTFARRVPPSRSACDLNAIVRDALSFLESRCTKGQIELKMDLSAGLPALVVDPPQIKQVLVNLVVNAIQAMPGGGTLGIVTRAAERGVRLVVEDTGIGMTEEVRDRIFIPFFTTKDVGEGTGLGLSVVHGIVLAHSGTIRVDSRPDQGSRFEIMLPCEGAARAEENA